MIRIATFNLENLDEVTDAASRDPSLAVRSTFLRPALARLRADIICFQEIHGQEREGQPRDILALREVLAPTRYARHQLVSTKKADGSEVYDKRNLVTAFPADYELLETKQINGDRVPNPLYRRVIAGDETAKELTWERPLLYTKLKTPDGIVLHILNVHFKSKLATRASHLMADRYSWKSAAGWAEGYFVSSMKRVGAALEARVVIDDILDADDKAHILIAGDFNCQNDEVPMMAIRGRVRETGNVELAAKEMFPLENNIPESSRYSLFHHGKGEMIDHVLVSRSLASSFVKAEIHNEFLQDESLNYSWDSKFPDTDHAPVIAEFDDELWQVSV